MGVGLTMWLGETVQWIALGIGLYASFSWMQSLSLRDPAAFTMIFRSKALVCGVTGFAFITFVTYGLGFWFAPLYQRELGEAVDVVGRNFGLASAVGGWAGVTFGGVFSDWLRNKTPRARPYVGLIAVVTTVPLALWQIYTTDPSLGFKIAYVHNFTSSMWLGSGVALANELVLPRMRATASAFSLLMLTFVGLAMGPFTIGKISDALAAGGMDTGVALQHSMALSLLAFAVSAVFFVIAAKYVKSEEETRLERAREAGETGI